MIVWLSILAALIGAISSGVATVLQKISADRIDRTKSMSPALLLKLLRDWPYLTGIILDLLSWGLTLVAVHNLALFVVQPILAFTIVATVLVESLVFHNNLSKRTLLALAAIVIGLGLLGLTATSETASSYDVILKYVVALSPLGLLGLASLFVRSKNRTSSFVLAAISGLSFGGASIAGRMIVMTGSYIHLIYEPLIWAMIAYGIIAILLLTIALQRLFASMVIAVVITTETISAILVGLIYLGDSPRQGLWIVMITGALIATCGSLSVALDTKSKV